MDEQQGGAPATDIAASETTGSQTASGWDSFLTDSNEATRLPQNDNPTTQATGEATTEAQATTETGKSGDATQTGATADPWAAYTERVKAEATKGGFNTPEEMFAAQQAEATRAAQATAQQNTEQQEQQWLRSKAQEIANAIQARVDSGEIDEEQAETEFRRDLQLARYERQNQMQQVDFAVRDIQQEYQTAVTANPLLGHGDGIAGTLIEGMALAGLVPAKAASEMLSHFATAVATAAVAQHIAAEAAKHKNVAPTVNPGAAAPTAPAAATRNESWDDFLLRRDIK